MGAKFGLSAFISFGFLLAIEAIAVDNRLVTPAVVQENLLKPAATNYGPQVYQFNPQDAVDHYRKPINAYNNGYPATATTNTNYEDTPAKYQEYSSIEQDSERYNDADFQNPEDFYDTQGYKHYNTKTSFNLVGPKQLETITTKSFHREVEPYDISGFHEEEGHELTDHDHQAEEEHAEVHYHQHKHLHKHSHKQNHVHKHKGDHKHEHGHKHQHQSKHNHHHEGQHQHKHQGQHKHQHHGEHKHQHNSDHKHQHKGHHGHEHKHHDEHKHNAHHEHKHSSHGEHKHSHHSENHHDHHHGHQHHSEHKHKHSHHGQHKHKHGHDSHHKHDHHAKHHHSHHKH